jgi:NAD(P)-dependent dehydrogenase (short-subunit alcohol dehydrogenase family)
MSLDGKVAIVTGAGSQGPGIGNGRAAAVLLARAGARVALVDIAVDSLRETGELIDKQGGEWLAVTGDVSDAAACAGVVERVVGRFGGLNILVNNVGILGPPGTVVDLDLAGWEQCLRVNVTSMVLMSRFAIPHLRAAGGGSIVNMSSVAGLVGGLPMLAYSASKGAINSLTRTMACQHGPENIRVNAVAPGFVYTPMVGGLSAADRETRRLAAPLRTEGTGWDVGRAVVYLVSDDARWITGTILPVDGGLTADGVGMARPLGIYEAE